MRRSGSRVKGKSIHCSIPWNLALPSLFCWLQKEGQLLHSQSAGGDFTNCSICRAYRPQICNYASMLVPPLVGKGRQHLCPVIHCQLAGHPQVKQSPVTFCKIVSVLF